MCCPPRFFWGIIFFYNYWQWISWLTHRWRTQQTAKRNVNCRARESSNLWTHIAPFGLFRKVCLFENHELLTAQIFLGAWIWAFQLRLWPGIHQLSILACNSRLTSDMSKMIWVTSHRAQRLRRIGPNSFFSKTLGRLLTLLLVVF